MAKKKPTSKSNSPAKQSPSIPVGYAELLNELKIRIRSAQLKALVAVNHELVTLYWQIGRNILGRQQSEGWGPR